jgi:uncharacterized protein YecE (DUF72 family)
MSMAKQTPKPIAKPKLARAARRLKQRAENPERAQKMHDARISGAHSTLFDNIMPVRETGAGKSGATTYHIGCSGWYYWDWKGKFYPEDLPTGKWFDYYMKNFDTVELNAPFYSWPTIATVRTWFRQAKQRPFIYTVKVCELITHVKRFSGTKVLIKDFGLIAELLGPHMGCFLFQLPPSYHYSPARLQNILGQLDLSRRNVVEFRHESWWNDKVFTAFRKAGVIFCSCSGPKLPDRLVKTADDIYVRFHGTQKWYRHDYSPQEMDEWAARIQKCSARHAWVYFNNDYDGFAIKNARELIQRLNARRAKK